MQIAPFNYIKRSKHFDPSKWPLSNSNNISPQADLMVHLPQIRDDHVKYISELARYSNEVNLNCIYLFMQLCYCITSRFCNNAFLSLKEQYSVVYAQRRTCVHIHFFNLTCSIGSINVIST